MAREPLSFGEDVEEEVRARQQALYESDPLLGPGSGLVFNDPNQIVPEDPLAFPEDAAPEDPLPGAFGEAAFAEAGGRYSGMDGANPDRAPAPEQDVELPFGDYDPADIRVQYLQRIGRTDGNFANMVLERFSSGDEEPTPQEVFNAADDAARAVAGDLGISTRSNEGKLQIQELTEAFSRMYREQKGMMKEQGLLTPGEAATDADATTENRVKAGLAEISVGGPDTYETYERILTAQGAFNDDMTPEQRDSKVAEMILRDLKDVKVPAADLKRLRNQLYAGEWGDLRAEREGPPMPTPQQLREAQEQADAEAAGPGFLERLFSDTDEVEDPTPPATPTTPPTFGQIAEDPGGALSGDRPENPYRAVTRQLREDQDMSRALEVASSAALDAVTAPDAPLSEDLIDAGRRFARGATEVIASVPMAGAIAAPVLEESRIRALGGGGMDVPEREARIEEIRQILISGVDPEREALIESTEGTLDLTPEQRAEMVQLTDARRDQLSQEQQTLAQSIRESRAVGTAADRRGLDTAADIRNWTADTFGVPDVENDDALWAQVSEGLGSSAAFLSQTVGPGGMFRGAALGATASASGAYEQAIARGATEEEATEAAGIMALVGMTEVVPLTRMLDRLPVNVRGGVRKRVAKYLGDVVKEGGEEALQEGFQQVMGNITAQNVYDFETDTWEGVQESMTVGGITGLILPGVLGVPGVVRGDPPADTPSPDELEQVQEEVAETPMDEGITTDAPDAPEVLDEQAPTERDADDAPFDTSGVDELLSQIMTPAERQSGEPESQLQSDLPDRIEQIPTEDIIRAVAESDTRREEVREAALPEADIPAEAMTRVEAEAGSVAPSPEEVELAATTSSEIAALQAQVDEGTRTLTDNDRQALSVLTHGADEILAAADRVVIDARNAMTEALGADIDAPIRVTGAARDNVEQARRRGNRQRTRAAIERRNRDQASNAMATLRNFGEGAPAPDASIIGALAGLPRGTIPALTGTTAEISDANEAIGSYQFRNDLRLPSTASSAVQQAEALTGALEAMDRHQQMLRNLSIAQLTDPDGNPNTDLARQISQGRVAEAEPLRQLLQTRVFRGADSGLIDQLSIVSLASATDEQLRRWGTARGPEDIQDLDTALGIRDQILPRSQGATAQTEERREADLALIRKSARVVENVRTAERKTARARDAITRALDVLNAVAAIDESGTDLAGFIDGVRSATREGVPDAVALRESLRRNAPNIAEREGAQPLKEMVAQIGIANSRLPVDLRVDRNVLARAYENTLTNEQLFGDNWRARRLVRKLDQTSVAKTVDQIMALEPTSDPLDVQTAREELGAMAVAEQLLLQERLPALREQLATARREGQPYAHLIGEISSTRVMDPNELGEMLVNEFGLDIDTAAGVVIRGQEMADAAQGDTEAIRAVAEGADELLAGVHFFEGRTDLDFVGIDPDGAGITGLPTDERFSDPDPDIVIAEINEQGLARKGAIAIPHSRELSRVAVMLSNVSRDLRFDRGTIVFPLQGYSPDYANAILAAVPEADREYVQSALTLSSEVALERTLRGGTGTVGGFMLPTPRGNLVFVDPELPVGQMAAIAAHEMGHAMTVDMISSAVERSPKTAEMLYRAYRESPYGDVEAARFFPRVAGDESRPAPAEFLDYINNFDEWLASRVGEYIVNRPERPTGLVNRLIDSIARIWRRIREALVPTDTTDLDNRQLTDFAVAQLAENHVRHAMGALRDENGDYVDLRNRDWRTRAGIPTAKAEIDGLLEQTPFDLDTAPMSRALFARRPEASPRQRLTDADQQTVRAEFTGLTSGVGVTIRFADTADRISVRDKNTLGTSDVGYRPPASAASPGVVLVDLDKVQSVPQAVKAIRRALVVNQGLDAVLGRNAVDRLKQTLLDPTNSTLGKPSAAVTKRLQNLKRQVVRDLTVDGERPSEATIADTMLGRLAEEAISGDYADAARVAAPILRRALQLGDQAAFDDTHLMGLLTQAQNPQNYAGSGMQASSASKRNQNLASDIIDKGLTAVETRNDRSEPSRIAFRETTLQRLWRAYSDYALPIIRLQRLGQATAADSNASAETREIGTELFTWGRNLADRLKGYNNQLKRVLDNQYEVHASMDEEFSAFMSELGYDVSKRRSRQAARRDANLFMSARASIERNEHTALVYGRLDDEGLEQQRRTIIQQADAAVQAVQGDNRRRTADSFDQVRQIRRDQMAQLRDLLLGTTAPDNTVKRYIESSRRGVTPRDPEDWMDVSGISTGLALEIIRQIDGAHNGRFINTFMSSGMDGRLRRLIDQTYENRVMSGVYGASGELFISRLGMEHHSPLRGLEIGQGRIVRDDEFGQPQLDVGFLATGLRAPATRLAPNEALRYYRSTAAVTDVLDTGQQEYMSSIREMTTNHINGALVGLARAMDAMGIAEGVPADRRPINVSEEIPYLVWRDPNTGEDFAQQDDEGTRIRVRNPQIERARNTINEDGKTGSLLHALPNGNYLIIQINDPTIYRAMTYRFDTRNRTEAGDFVRRAFGELTRITARTFTSWDPLYTTFRAVTRDLQEGAVMAFFEQGVSARRTASLPVRAARLAPRLEAFFQSGEGRRNEMLARAMANTSHPMHNFARRWNAGEVQTFAQQLELITDRADASSNLLASGAEFIQNNAVTRRLEAHADAMENAVRQAVIDVLEETYVEQGLSPEEAQRRAYEQGISLLDFAQRSDVGETVQPFVPFAQSAITGASAMIERRIWRGGQPPVSAQSTYVDDDGKVRYSVDWNQVLRQLNWPMMASLTAAGFFNVMLMGATAGIAWNLLGGDDEDELDAEARGDIEKIRSKYIGPSEDAEAQTWLVENLNAAARKWVHRDAEIDTLDELKIASVMSGWVMPWQTDDRQGAAPISYGIVSQFVNLGQAAALIALGKDPSRVTAAYTNSTIRNLTPLDAPYNDTPQGVSEFMMMAVPPTFSQIYEWVQGETLDGIRLRNESPFDLGPTPYGPSNTPRFTQSLAFNEALFDLGVTMQEAGHDMGIPWAGAVLRRALPDGARLENLMSDVPVIGQHMADALRETENIMMENASRGDDLYDAGDAARWLGDRVLVGSGFAKRDPQKAARTDYYEQLRWSGWDDLATYDRDTLRGVEYENSDYNEIRKAVGSIQGLMQRQEGLAKKEQLRIYTEEYKTAQTQEDRAEAMRKMDEIENGVDARFRAAAETLRRMKAHVNRTAPRIVGD